MSDVYIAKCPKCKKGNVFCDPIVKRGEVVGHLIACEKCGATFDKWPPPKKE